MSKPVSNVEIEDVLASIRRLVSDDGRSGAAEPAKQAESAVRASAPQSVERLVLTPAQRVAVSDPEPQGRPTEGAGEAPILLTDPKNVPAQPETESAQMADASAPDRAAPVNGADADVLAKVVQDELAALFASESEKEDEAESDAAEYQAGGDTEDMSASEEDASQALDSADNAEPDELPEEAVQTPEPAEAMAEPRSVRSGMSLEDKIAELESMIGGASEEWDSDMPGDGENAAFAHGPEASLDWEDTPMSGALFQSRRAGHLASMADDLEDRDDRTGSVPALDEEALRSLVAGIVRQELQGTLGERITRNVRKLVRREIQRALASQDFE